MNEELKEELQFIVDKLGGTMEELFTGDHAGRTSKKIVIEYDVQRKK